MSNYSMTGTPIGAFDISTIDISGSYNKSLPNKKISLSIHEANGGYIMEIVTHPGQTPDLYIISQDKDLGQEIGKIITYNILQQNESTNSQNGSKK